MADIDGELVDHITTTKISTKPYRFRIAENASYISLGRITVAAGASLTAISLPEDYSASTYDRVIIRCTDPNDSADLVVRVSGTGNQARAVNPICIISDKASSLHVTNSDATNAASLYVEILINTA